MKLRGSEAIQRYAERLNLDCFVAYSSQVAPLARVEDNAGDDEHSRHRQHLRKRFRGRPFGGFLHGNSLDLGKTHRCMTSTLDGLWFLLGTPRDEYSLGLSPHSANIDRLKIDQQ